MLEALAGQAVRPAVRPSDSDVSIEIVFDDDGEDDVAVTNRFVRFSAPYERVDIEPLAASLTSMRRFVRPTTFVKTVPAPLPPAATAAFDKVWFDQPEDALVEVGGIEAAPPTNSWLWLGLSLLAGALAVGAMIYATS